VKTDDGGWLNLDPTNNFIYGYVAFEQPLSNPTSSSSDTYRAFYAQDTAFQDSNIVGVQFQEEMLFAGRGDALMSFDGYRMSVAGCTVLNSATGTRVAAVGALSAGTYQYILRPKTTKPSGQITYGPPVTFTVAGVLANEAVAITPLYVDTLLTSGSDYAGVATSPRRYNTLDIVSIDSGTQFTTNLASLERTGLQVGEYITTAADAETLSNTNRSLVTDITGEQITTTQIALMATDDIEVSLGEELEIYRTTAGGTAYYYVKNMPARYTGPAGTGYLDDAMPDASLTQQPSYIAKPYVIQRPPDCIASITQHQNRIVVVGEYRDTYDADDSFGSPSISTNRPYVKNVYWSRPNNEEFSPTDNVVLDITEGGELNSCISTGDALYVGGGESMWVLQGNLSSALSYTVNRIAGAGGTVGNTAIAALNGQVYAVSRSGLYQLVGGAADYTIGLQVNAIIRAMRPELQKFIRVVALKKTTGLALILPGMVFERAAVKAAASDEVFPGSYVATENAADTVTLVYNPNTQSWSRWTGTEMYMGGGLVEFDGQTWAFPRKSGKPICVLDSEYAKDGYDQAVEMSIKGPWHTDGDVFTDKSFVRFRVFSAAGGRQNFVLTTKIERNWVEDQTWQSAEIPFRDGEGYGQGAYGETPYGDPNEIARQIALTNQKALSVRAVIENSDPAEFPSISAWNFEIGENRKNMKQE
jgi:hypothetical protein